MATVMDTIVVERAATAAPAKSRFQFSRKHLALAGLALAVTLGGIDAIEGRTKEQKRALIKDITDAVVKNFDVTADAVLVEIIESSRDNKAKGGVLFSER